MSCPRESLKGWKARKKAKGRWGKPKGHLWKGKEIFTGYCPCDDCDHKYMLHCDPDYDNCVCCDEVCS